jgi:hypothetical protein
MKQLSMRQAGIVLGIAVLGWGNLAAAAENNLEWLEKSKATREERMAWWEDARFALFIHWGAYSVLGGEYEGQTLEHLYAEQIQRIAKIPHDEYREHAASKFRPDAFDAEEWVLLAKAAGMKYVVITAKHHDGFAIYHSKHSDFDVEDTSKWKRDPLKELSDACKKHGLVFGVYYSQSQDWHDVFVGDWDTPGNPAASTAREWADPANCDSAAANRTLFEAYMERKGIPQVVELVEDYDVKLIWFDTPGAYPKEYGPPFVEAIRAISQDVVVNARIGAGVGDYQGGPDSPVTFFYQNHRYWEAIQSTLHSWGYNKFDEGSRRPTDHLLRMLATVVSKGGNMMINVGPKPDGTLVENDVKTLKDIAEWSQDHIESIHGAGRSPLPVQNWGVVTSKDHVLYLHVFDWPECGKLRLGGLKTDVVSAELLKAGLLLKTQREEGHVLEIDLPEQPSHPIISVIRLTCAGQPVGEEFRLLESDQSNRLHVTDTRYIASKHGFRRLDHASRLQGWTDPQASITWKVRVDRKADYTLHTIYDFPKNGVPGGRYRVSVGPQAFEGVVSQKGSVPESLIEDEMKRVRQTRKARMTGDKLGTFTLEPGTYDITWSAVGDIQHKELLDPRAVLLVPEQTQ